MLASKTEGTDVTEYYYDLMGNLKGVDLPDGTTIEYLVDGFGRRTWKKVDGVLEKGWIYKDALNPVAELDGSGNVVSYFVYGNMANVPAYMLHNESGVWVRYRFVVDFVGSVRYVVRETDSEIAQEITYTPFGEVISDTTPGFQPFAFAGGLYDEQTGLVRFGARDYDAETGRWQSKDPILFWGGDTNLSAYVGNDPINYIDPEGKFAWALVNPCTAGAAALVGAAYWTATPAGQDFLEDAWDAATDLFKNFADKVRSPFPIGKRRENNSNKKARERATKAGKGKPPIHHPNGHPKDPRPHYHPDVPQPKVPTPKSPSPHDHYYYPK